MSSAKEIFRIGDRVKLSPEFERVSATLRKNTVKTGVVVGFGCAPHWVRVRVDGQKQTKRYHVKFWKRA